MVMVVVPDNRDLNKLLTTAKWCVIFTSIRQIDSQMVIVSLGDLFDFKPNVWAFHSKRQSQGKFFGDLKRWQTISTRARFAPLWVTSPSPGEEKRRQIDSVLMQKIIYNHKCQRKIKSLKPISWVSTRPILWLPASTWWQILSKRRRKKEKIAACQHLATNFI